MRRIKRTTQDSVNTDILAENHGVPGSNPGPATIKMGVLQVKRLLAETEDASAHHKDTTTNFAGGAGGGVMRLAPASVRLPFGNMG